jgi:hypothetical protein
MIELVEILTRASFSQPQRASALFHVKRAHPVIELVEIQHP